ncbi:hypothetical protein VTN00DRAFT_3210 [Thermoascus crustaceus]|uniref:uncharacterized protein n=1 Tax=Thermoascus crustaceus TaxID=5088 RepID=UPI0037425465
MVHLTLFVIAAFCVALFSHPVSAWTFVWRNASGDATIAHSQRSQGCQKMNHAQGMEFDWDPEGDTYCLGLYRDENCTDRGGFSCPLWRKKSSQDLLSFNVKVNGDFGTLTTTTSSATSTSTSSSLTLPTQTASQQTSQPSSIPHSSRKLSGGAIAGIVIGIVVGVVVIAAASWLLGRRQRKPSGNAIAPPEAPAGPMPGTAGPLDKSTFAATEKLPQIPVDSSPVSPDEPPMRPAPGSRMVELAADMRMAELSDSQRVVELEGSRQYDGYEPAGGVPGR